MKLRNTSYWIAQLGGWSLLYLGNFISLLLNTNSSDPQVKHLIFTLIPPMIASIILGIVLSHTYRIQVIHRFGWNKMSFLKVIPRALISSLLLSALYSGISYLIFVVVLPQYQILISKGSSSLFNHMSSFFVLFMVWNLCYFLFHLFVNYKSAEISNLKLEALNVQMALDRLRNQMNPHLLFNSLNSVRALIDEDPEKAKEAINLLSALMRSSLMKSKAKFVSFSDELELVKKYIAIEKIRFEERIKVSYHIEDNVLDKPFAPLVLQTLVENAIKHGISKKTDGGTIEIKSFIENNEHITEIINTGHLDKNFKEGYGIQNTKERVKLLFGEKATFDIQNKDQNVIVVLKCPLIIKL